MSILIVSGHPVIEGVVRLAAGAIADVDDVATLPSADELEASIGRVEPDIIVIDVDPRSGIDPGVARRARLASGDARIVVLSDEVDGPTVLEAMRIEVHAFLRKPEALRDMGSVLLRVLAGERVIDPDLARSAVLELGRFARQAREASEVGASLTPREREVLELLAEGFTMQQIGRRLGISPRTVETHVAKLYRKLEVRTRLQAVARAAQLGLIHLR